MCELDLTVGVFFSSDLAIRIFGTCEKKFRGHTFCELSIFLYVRYGAHALSGAQKSGGKGFPF